MTLFEAIKHADNKAQELYEDLDYKTTEGNLKSTDKAYEVCMACAKEHEQLAAWLRELARLTSLEGHVDTYERTDNEITYSFSYHEWGELVTINILKQCAGNNQWLREYGMERPMSHNTFKLWCDNWFELTMADKISSTQEAEHD